MQVIIGASDAAAIGGLLLVLRGKGHIINNEQIQDLTAVICLSVAPLPTGKIIASILIDNRSRARIRSKHST